MDFLLMLVNISGKYSGILLFILSYNKCTLCTMLTLCTEIIIILSLTVSKRKNRCIPCAYLGTAIFIVVIEYCNLFPSFTLFLNCFHFTFGYELIVCSKSTSFMKIICNGLAFICRNKSLFLNLDKIYCFQGI